MSDYTLAQYKDLIEIKLDIGDFLEIVDNKIIPNRRITNKIIKDTYTDDLFQLHNRKIVFTNRFMSLVGEITNRQVLCGHYSLELRV